MLAYCALLPSPAIRGKQSEARHYLTSTMSMILLTAMMMPSRPGTGDILNALSIISSDTFRPLYTRSRRLPLGGSDDIQASFSDGMEGTSVVSKACVWCRCWHRLRSPETDPERERTRLTKLIDIERNLERCYEQDLPNSLTLSAILGSWVVWHYFQSFTLFCVQFLISALFLDSHHMHLRIRPSASSSMHV